MMKEENHLFQGLKRDTHPSKQDANFLWDAANIRLTDRDDSTLLSITNEKGPAPINDANTGKQIQYNGKYVGHCILGKYLIVFTVQDEICHTSSITGQRVCKGVPGSYIYRTTYENNQFKTVLLYSYSDYDYLWNKDCVIDAIGIYETDLIQKVYWVDGKHQPRMINITKPELLGVYDEDIIDYSDCYSYDSFDFVRSVNTNTTIKVNTKYGSGLFAPGVIQYAITYYDKYGQESCISLVSPLQTIAYKERGGSPEDRVAVSFDITLTNVDNKFDFLRVYSIQRTTVDTESIVKRIADVELDNTTTVNVTDTGTTGEYVDSNMLKYIGGKNIIAGTLAHKDGTLFLGNITINDQESAIRDILKNITITGENSRYESQSTKIGNLINNYYTNTSSINCFKTNEKYRLGIQAQLKDGNWTSPVFLGDKIVSNEYPNSKEDSWNYDGSVITTKYLSVDISTTTAKELLGKGVQAIRPCVVYPQPYERDIVCQGILNPTVFNIQSRSLNAPYAQASWFFRPSLDTDTGITENAYGGNIQFQNFKSLYTSKYGREIQSMRTRGASEQELMDVILSKDNTDFFVDSNIITLNSPDIEFDTSLANLDMSGFRLRIIGYTKLLSTYGDISITTSSPPIGSGAAGFEPNIIGYPYRMDSRSYHTNGGLVSQYFYKDNEVKTTEKDGVKDVYTAHNIYKNFQVCPWQRSGSLNNDMVRPADKGTRTAVLKEKKISNLKYFSPTIVVDDSIALQGGSLDYSIETPQLFNSDQVSLLKINVDYSQSTTGNSITKASYYGNVDTLLSPNSDYDIIRSTAYSKGTIGNTSREPIRMKYKSAPHIVTRFKDTYKNNMTILPKLWTTPVSHSDSFQIPDFMVQQDSDAFISDETKYETNTAFDSYIYPEIGLQFDFTDETEISNWWGRGYYLGYNSLTDDNYETLELFTIKYEDSTVIKELADTSKIYGIYKNSTVHLPQGVSNSLSDLFPEDCREYTAGIPNQFTLNKNLYLKYKDGGWRLDNYTSNGSHVAALSNDSYKGVTIQEQQTNLNVQSGWPYLFIGELYRVDNPNKFGGTSDLALQSNLWYPAGDAVPLIEEQGATINYTRGDTWYCRYDCLKTYPFTQDDENSIIEIGSFMCESRVNLDGRYDRNKGNLSNLNATPQNFNLINNIYSQHDNFFNYRILDDYYYKSSIFNNQITWSKEKHSAEDTDTWTNITLANTLDLPGDKGNITALKVWNENIFCFQDQATNIIKFNSRVQIPVSDGVPIEITNGYKVDGYTTINDNIGCQYNKSVISTDSGLYFVDNNKKGIYMYNGQFTNLSDNKGLRQWVVDNNSEMKLYYDSISSDIYFDPSIKGIRDTDPVVLCYSEKLQQFISKYSYHKARMFNYCGKFVSLYGGEELFINNDIDRAYLYENNKGEYNIFFNDKKVGWYLTFVSNQNPTYTKIFDTIEFRSSKFTNGKYDFSRPFNYIKVWNDYQNTGDVIWTNRTLREKFRVWRGQIPRVTNSSARIRNPWTKIELGCKISDISSNTSKVIINDISVKYTV